MVMGRPREYDREDIFRQLLEWVQLPNSLNLNAFCYGCEPKISPRKLLAFVDEDKDFQELYEIAKSCVSARREEANCDKLLSDTAYNRSARYFDYFERQHWKKEKQFESSLRKDEEGNKPSQIIVKVSNDGLGAGLNISAQGLSDTANKSA